MFNRQFQSVFSGENIHELPRDDFFALFTCLGSMTLGFKLAF